MQKFLILSILVAVFAFGECWLLWNNNEIRQEDQDVSCLKEDVDQYLDEVLEKARQELDDPMRLPPRSSVVELSDGLLWGMSNITRRGQTIVRCEGNKIHIRGKITTDELKGRYTWTHERRRETKEGYVVFISHDFEADIKVSIERIEGQVTHPQLERFEIQRFKDAKIEISGASYLGWALGELTTLMSGVFQRAIAHAIQDPVREALERQLQEINIE